MDFANCIGTIKHFGSRQPLDGELIIVIYLDGIMVKYGILGSSYQDAIAGLGISTV